VRRFAAESNRQIFLGVCIVASYWDTLDAMTASEQAVQVSRKEVTGLLGGTVTVEHYEVPVFVRRSRPHGGAGVRLTRVDCAPASIDAVIEEFRNTAVPALTAMAGLCSAHMMTDRATGRCIVITAWDDMDALAASRPATARLRADVAAVTHLQVLKVGHPLDRVVSSLIELFLVVAAALTAASLMAAARMVPARKPRTVFCMSVMVGVD